MTRRKPSPRTLRLVGILFAIAAVVGLIIFLPQPWAKPTAPSSPGGEQTNEGAPGATALRQPASTPMKPYSGTPTPDPTRESQPDPIHTQVYVVRNGDTLAAIAQDFGCTLAEIVALNRDINPDAIWPGQKLLIPVGASSIGPDLKLVPDSELVYGPAYVHFKLEEFIAQQGGYLSSYTEEVEGHIRTGAEIVQLVAQRYSLGPRVLLALLELQSEWVTNPSPSAQAIAYPMGSYERYRQGLFRQLSWAASELNGGYYGWKYGGWTAFALADGTKVAIAPGLNSGTVAIQNLLARTASGAEWRRLLGPSGFAATYARLFGNPFAYGIEPLIPAGLTQPELKLPWEGGQLWYLTGGPHAGWGEGSAWAALDFAPGGKLGCQPSPTWVVAAADGLVLRSDYGEVIVDLDSDGNEQTGWVLTYMHIFSEGSIAEGIRIRLGERIGRPSCEGGVAEATHVHFARRYNGEWIPAGRAPVPMVLSGWEAQEAAHEYDGTLVKDGQLREACNCDNETLNGLVSDNFPISGRSP